MRCEPAQLPEVRPFVKLSAWVPKRVSCSLRPPGLAGPAARQQKSQASSDGEARELYPGRCSTDLGAQSNEHGHTDSDREQPPGALSAPAHQPQPARIHPTT